MSDVLEANWYETEQPKRPRRRVSRGVVAAVFVLLAIAGVVVAFAGLAVAGDVPTCGGG
ncbi:hypothetical protein [Actinocorallia longicatena]|uniref:Uncharacterized protein n=1 Tax=Actinocorallia longicatena TaxID=111803 RepID=A0ABP6QPJ2_9ACTN